MLFVSYSEFFIFWWKDLTYRISFALEKDSVWLKILRIFLLIAYMKRRKLSFQYWVKYCHNTVCLWLCPLQRNNINWLNCFGVMHLCLWILSLCFASLLAPTPESQASLLGGINVSICLDCLLPLNEILRVQHLPYIVSDWKYKV